MSNITRRAYPVTGFRWAWLGLVLQLTLSWSPAVHGAAPVISSFSPSRGLPGTRVTINGANFNGALQVTFNNFPAEFVLLSGSQISCVVPVDATTGPVTVSTAGGTAISSTFFLVGPRIDNFTPARGPPGTQVIIDGANFENTTRVEFNTNAAAYAVTGLNQIQATVPAGATTGPIRVATPAGTNASAVAFVVTGFGPQIDSFEPVQGTPGTQITIMGERLDLVTAVFFQSNRSATFRITASSQLIATVPPGAITGPIRVASPQGTNSSAQVFVVSGGPVITDFDPRFGVVGSQVTILGENFTGATAVRFNGTNAAFAVVSASQITAAVPAKATTGPISVTTAAGTGFSSNAYVVVTGAPIITGFSPAFGVTGTVVRIVGDNFAGATAVRFHSNRLAVFQVTAPAEVYAAVPAGATNGPIQVINSLGTGTSSDHFRVIGPEPFITDFSPAGGGPGTRVTVNGANFALVTNVTFNGVRATNVHILADTQLEATVPTNALTGPIFVFNQKGRGSSSNTFFAAPRITSFTPNNGPVTTVVSITGVNFTGATVVLFNGREATFQVVSSNLIQATIPVGATTGPISVAGPGGAATTLATFEVVIAADLGLQIQGPLAPALKEQPLTCVITLTNQGPNLATGIVVSNLLNVTGQFLSAVPSQGQIAFGQRNVIWRAGNLASQGHATLTLTIQLVAPGNLVLTAGAVATELDHVPGNNTASFTIPVIEQAMTRLQIGLTNDALVLWWPAAVSNYVLESAVQLPTTNWTAVTNPVLLASDRFSVRITNNVPSRFFRLRRQL